MAADVSHLRAMLDAARRAEASARAAPPSIALEVDGLRWVVELARPLPISIPLRFDRAQPNAFGLPRARARAFVAGAFVGDTRRGGSVNCDTLELTPHGNGTHTECVGHLVDEPVPVADALDELLVVTRVVSVRPRPFGRCHERYADVARPDDQVVTRRELSRALLAPPLDTVGLDAETPFRGLVIRTLPNDADKAGRSYGGTNPPYLTIDAIRYVRSLGVDHLLLDLPSADREDDGGLLPVHREFWDVRPRSHRLDGAPCRRTITELVYVRDEIPDGWYLMNLQLPHFVCDAAPSRPLLFPIVNVASIAFGERDVIRRAHR